MQRLMHRAQRCADLLVGKSPACTVRITDEAVSRRHLALDVVGTRIRVLDLDSTNGTRVNGAWIREALLAGDEVVRIGDTGIAVRRKGPRYVSLPQQTSFGRVFGSSAAMRKLFPSLGRIATIGDPVDTDAIAAGMVADTLPVPGTKASSGDEITLLISTGQAPPVLPPVQADPNQPPDPQLPVDGPQAGGDRQEGPRGHQPDGPGRGHG